MALPFIKSLWSDQKLDGRQRTEEILAEGNRIAIVAGPVSQDPIIAIVTISDLKALSALSELRISQVAALLESARTQVERKAIVRLIDWLEKIEQGLD